MQRIIQGMVLVLLMLLSSCSITPVNPEPVEKQLDSLQGIEQVLPNVYDDGYNSVYIKSSVRNYEAESQSVAEILSKKKSWQALYPNKRVVSISMVTGGGGGYGHPIVDGMIIHYEIVK